MKIPVGALLLEIVILIGMFAVSGLVNFSFLGVTFSFIYYEIIRIVLVLKNGRRTTNFAKQYVVAVLAMVPFYLLTMFVALVYRAVCG